MNLGSAKLSITETIKSWDERYLNKQLNHEFMKLNVRDHDIEQGVAR